MRDSFDRYNVIAAFPDMDAARHAIGALEEQGVDAGAISLLGQAAEQAQHQAEEPYRDEEFSGKAMRVGVGGALAGTAIGGVLGFALGMLGFGVPGLDPVNAGGLWAATLGGAAAGGGVGVIATANAKIKQSEAWELAHQPVEAGQVIVGVHSEAENEVHTAAAILRQQNPLSVNEFDAKGRRVHRA
jgi:hypothetical protein